MKHIELFEANEDDKLINKIVAIMHKELKPGTDKGSTQAIVDTKDFKKAAIEIVKLLKA